MSLVDNKLKVFQNFLLEYKSLTNILGLTDGWDQFRLISYEQMNGSAYSGEDIDRDFWKEWIAYFGDGSEVATDILIDDHKTGFKLFLEYYTSSIISDELIDIDVAVYNQIINEDYAIFLPQQNLLSNYVMQNGELVDKVGGEGQELLFPCFSGLGSVSTGVKKINTSLTVGTTFHLLLECKGMFSDNEYNPILGGATAIALMPLYITSNSSVVFSLNNDERCDFPIPIELRDIRKVELYRNGSDVQLFINDSPVSHTNNTITATSTTDISRLFARYWGNLFWFNGIAYNLIIDDYHFPLTGHAYGFQSDGTVITGTPSDSSCFEGLCNYNPEEAYNFEDDVQPRNLVCPARRVSGEEHLDINGNEINSEGHSGFLGGNAMPPYAVYNAKNLTGDYATAIQAIMLRDDYATITDRDNQKYGYDADNEYYWNISTLLRLPEFLKSLQTNWHLFMKVRNTDLSLEQFIIYSADPSAIDEAQRLKILKATKDTTTDARDHEAYISCGELSTTGLKTGCAMLNEAESEATVGEVGSEELTNGSFGNWTGLDLDNWDITNITQNPTNHIKIVSGGDYAGAIQDGVLASGIAYIAEITITDYQSGTLQISSEGGTFVDVPQSNGIHTVLFVSSGVNFELKREIGSAINITCSQISVKAITGMVEITHSVSSDHEFRNDVDSTGVPAPILKKDSNDKFYWDWSVEGTKVTSEINGVETALTGTYKYAQDENGDWHEIVLSDTNNKELRKDDFATIDYKMYGFISTNTEM